MAKGAKTGGRTAGTPNKDKAPVLAKAKELGVDPVDAMLELTAWAYKEWQETKDSDMAKRVLDYASQAAPYVRPKLSSIEAKGDKENPMRMVHKIILCGPDGV
jgi:hypothetical protein